MAAAGSTPPATDAVMQALARMPDAAARRRLLLRSRHMHNRAAVECLTDEVPRFMHADVEQGHRLAEAAAWIAERLADEYAQARARRARANVLFARGKYAEAVEQYDSALATFTSLNDEVEAARTRSSVLQPLIYLGRYDEALAGAKEARTVFARVGDRLRVARVDSNVANLHYRLDRFEEALMLYRRALEEFVERGQPRDVAVALRNMAVCHISLNQFPEALRVYRRARIHCQRHDLPLLVVEADYNVAYLYYLRGKYTHAIELYQRARQRSVELGDRYHGALCDLDQSELYLELNLVEEGVHLARQAFAGFEALGMPYEAAKAMTHLAIGAGRQGQPIKALELFATARDMFAREGNRIWPGLIDAYRALVLTDEGRYFEARRYGEAALGVFEGTGLASKAALCELVLSRVHLDIGEQLTARRLCLSALERLAASDEPSLTYRAHLLLGQVEEALGHPQEAFAAYRQAYERLETLRSHLEQDELKIGFLKDKLAVYESLVWLTITGAVPADAAQAVRYMEQAKSRGLADLMAFRAQELPGRLPMRSKLVERVQDLRQELNWYYRKIDRAELRPEQHSAREIERLRGRSRDRETQLLRTLREVKSGDQEFASLQGATVDLEAIRAGLPDGTVLLEYYQARGTILAAVVGRDRLEIVPLTPESRVRHLLRLLQFQLGKFRLGDDYLRTFGPALQQAVESHLRELYAELLAPVRPLLQADHVVIVPHDFLHYLPFHALLDGDRYLIDDFTLSYAPSAGVHHLCRAKRSRGRGSLVLGVPDAATPFVEQEARVVASALPEARLFLGEDASEQTLRTHGAAARFVHIATHGLFRYDNPMFSSLQLGGSRLSLFDLYQLELDAELVTLSGCGTGLNVVEGGDELLGLVRGLLYAGTQAALVTLWDVNDRSTARFMQLFYGRLPRSASKALALGAAMSALREEYPHPYHWAPFILVGNAGRP